MKIFGLYAAACAAALIASGTAQAQDAPPPPRPAGPAGARPAGPPPGFRPPAPMRIWAPKKTPFSKYDAPNKPLWKIADVQAMNRGKANWTQRVVSNKDIVADWKQIAPGTKTPSIAYPDNRTGIIVWGGEVKVTMEGQEPFIARKGFEIDVPMRIPFTLEAQGSEPVLYLEVHASSDVPIYPVETTPTKPANIAGYVYDERFATGGAGSWDAQNKPYLDYYKDVIGGGARAGAFVSSQHMFINNIRGRSQPTPPTTNLGHYHIGYDEFWFVMEGNVEVQIEGIGLVKATPGDIVTAAQGRFHRASFGGPEGQMSTRVAINPYPNGLHGYTIESGGRQ
jgi:mannose-6-phosphate isomerase-like protein (cupin superfamily)